MSNLFGHPDAVVYLLQYNNEAIYKIGYTSKLNTRVRRIAVLMPHKVEAIHHIYTDDPRWLESHWHNKFASKRLPGSGIKKPSEWFNLTSEDVADFKSHTTYPRPVESSDQNTLDFASSTLREEAIQRVVAYYDALISQYPQRTIKLVNSCNWQISRLNAEILQLASKHKTEEQAIGAWEKSARNAADKKVPQ